MRQRCASWCPSRHLRRVHRSVHSVLARIARAAGTAIPARDAGCASLHVRQAMTLKDTALASAIADPHHDDRVIDVLRGDLAVERATIRELDRSWRVAFRAAIHVLTEKEKIIDQQREQIIELREEIARYGRERVK